MKSLPPITWILLLAMMSLIACDRATTSLGAGYQLLRLGGHTVEDNYYCIVDRDGSLVVPVRITSLEVSRDMIIGSCVNDPWPPEQPDFYKGIPPEPFDGYFVVEKRTRQVHLKLTEEELHTKLKQSGHAWPPKLEYPSKWLR